LPPLLADDRRNQDAHQSCRPVFLVAKDFIRRSRPPAGRAAGHVEPQVKKIICTDAAWRGRADSWDSLPNFMPSLRNQFDEEAREPGDHLLRD
jgi:hypothetical protein